MLVFEMLTNFVSSLMVFLDHKRTNHQILGVDVALCLVMVN